MVNVHLVNRESFFSFPKDQSALILSSIHQYTYTQLHTDGGRAFMKESDQAARYNAGFSALLKET